MSFHPRKVLAHLSVGSIKAHLQSSSPDLAGEMDWAGTEKDVRERLEQLLLRDGVRFADQIAALQRIFLMANEVGDRAMVAACCGDVSLRQELSARPNPQERALWLLGHDAARFEQAEEIRHSDHLYGTRSWTGFIGPLGAWPQLGGEPLQLFKCAHRIGLPPVRRLGRQHRRGVFRAWPSQCRPSW